RLGRVDARHGLPKEVLRRLRNVTEQHRRIRKPIGAARVPLLLRLLPGPILPHSSIRGFAALVGNEAEKFVDERPLRSAERSLQHCATLLTGNSFFQDSLM